MCAGVGCRLTCCRCGNRRRVDAATFQLFNAENWQRAVIEQQLAEFHRDNPTAQEAATAATTVSDTHSDTDANNIMTKEGADIAKILLNDENGLLLKNMGLRKPDVLL